MPSSPKIPREMILEYALKLLIREGFGAVNIKAIAKEIGCSTQPISWHFGNMEGLRSALSEYARNYAIGKLMNGQENAVLSFLDFGTKYLDIAFDEPNLFHYVFMNGCGNYIAGDTRAFSEDGENAVMTAMISQQLGISSELASQHVQDLSVYAHGLASYIATGVITISKEEAKEMLTRVGRALFKL